MAVKPIPEDYPRMVPGLACKGAADAIAFYQDVLGFELRYKMDGPEGTVAHSELLLGDSMIMVGDEFPDMGFLSPQSVGGSPVTITVHVTDAAAVHAKALEHGASEIRGVTDEFYGDRVASFTDPWGHRWTVSTHIEDLTVEEIEQRGKDLGFKE